MRFYRIPDLVYITKEDRKKAKVTYYHKPLASIPTSLKPINLIPMFFFHSESSLGPYKEVYSK